MNFSDPFGLMACDPPDDPDCKRTAFFGAKVDAKLGYGISVAMGLTFSRAEGPGVYWRGEVGAGLDADIAVEGGLASGREAFDGNSLSVCAGALGGGGCVSDSANGNTASAFVGKGPKMLPDVTVSASGANTQHVTWRDGLRAAARLMVRFEQALSDYFQIPR